jgi:D-amino-acid dehydrogenase
MVERKTQVLVVGAGVIGVCCAYFLARRGVGVTVLERDDIGKGASYGNAGTIAPGHMPINKPGRLRQTLKSILDPLSPLYIAPHWDPALLRWLWLFSRSCSAAHLDRDMQALGPMGHASAALFDELIETEALECGYRREGYYEVYLTERGLGAATEEAELIRRHGYRPEVLGGAALYEREPALNNRIVGGVFNPGAATLSPYCFVLEMAKRARRHGVTFQTGTQVTELLTDGTRVQGVRTSEGETLTAETVILAAGVYTTDLVRKLGYPLPLQAAKGYHCDREPREGRTPQLHKACILGETAVFCTPMEGFVRFAGTLEFSGINHEIRRPRLEQLTRAAARYFNGMAESDVTRSEWCGLRPCLPDGLPAVGPLPRYPNVFVATGHAMMGLTLGPITGKLIAEYVLSGKPSLDLPALRADRF